MLSWFNNFAFQGLVKSAHGKICRDHGFSQGTAPVAFVYALMLAHAAYPSGRWGTADADAVLLALPTPTLDWDSAGKLAHQYVHFNEGTLETCIYRMYGRSVQQLVNVCARAVA